MSADDELREQLADLAHQQWSGWMDFVFKFVRYDTWRGIYKMDGDKVARWQRQMNMDYAQLSEEEKDSDRIEADKVLALIARYREEHGQSRTPG